MGNKGKPARALFQYYWKGRMIPILVYAGDNVILDTGRQATDEGWDREAAKFEFDGDAVTLECFTEGRDCDGPLSSCDRFTCAYGDLAAHHHTDEHGVERRSPQWTRLDSAVYDESAVRAGY